MDPQDVKKAVEDLNRAFEEFKRTNDERLKQVTEKGVADPQLQAKLDRINADLDKFSSVADQFARLDAKVNRLHLAGGGPTAALSDPEAEVRSFNLEVKSMAQAAGRAVPGDISAEEYRAYKQAFNTYIRRGKDALYESDFKAMAVGTDPDGGYAVPGDMSGRIVVRRFESSPIRQIAAVQSVSTDSLEGLRDTDDLSSGGWVGETGARTATGTPQIGAWKIPIHEQYDNPGATQKLLDDASINIERWLADKVADKQARREGTAFVTGNGVAKPRGFASYSTAATADSARAWGVLEHVITGTNGGYGTDPNGANKLIDLVHKLKAHFRMGARFVMSRAVLGTTRQLKDGAGAYVWLPTMQAGQPSNLLGYPVTEAEDMAALGTGSLSVAFGNFALGYQIADRIGIRVLRDPYTNKPYVQFYTTSRVGGDVIDFEAIKFLNFTA